MFKDPFAAARFGKLFNEHRFSRFVETGTGDGPTSLKVADYCDVLTIEKSAIARDKAIERWRQAGFCQVSPLSFVRGGREIISILGDSAGILNTFMDFGKRPCFYLDAHGDDYWPLADELKGIAAARPAFCVIIIHDFKVPGKPWGYDSYKGQDLDLAYVKPLLDQINPHFKITFNEEAAGNLRGILYAAP